MDPAGHVPPPAHQQLEPIRPRLRDLDGVLQPLPGLEVVDHIRAVRVAADINIHVGAVLPALVARREVVVGDALPAVIEVFRLDLPGTAAGVPAKGDSAGSIRRAAKLKYSWSATIRRTWGPAVRVIPPTPTHQNVSHDPVSGTTTEPVTG